MKKCNQDIRCGAFAIYQEMRRGYTARTTVRCVYNPLWNTYIKNAGMICKINLYFAEFINFKTKNIDYWFDNQFSII